MRESNPSQIYVAKNFGQRGPFTEEEVYQQLALGVFSWDDLAWREGMGVWRPLREVLPEVTSGFESDKGGEAAVFHHIAPWKFLLFSLITFRIYELYWFYKGWRFVRKEEQSSILPFWRTIFAPIWFYPFAVRVFRREGRPGRVAAALLAVSYFLFGAAWQLPEPYSLLSMAATLVVLPLVLAVDRINREDGVTGRDYSRLGVPHIVTLGVCVPLFLMIVAAHFVSEPGSVVVSGGEMPVTMKIYLERNGLLPETEAVVLYYSGDPLGYRESGGFFTEKRVVSYWRVDRRIWMEEALWESVASLEVESPERKDAAVLKVLRRDGSGFDLVLPEDGADEFVAGARRFLE